MPSLALNFQNAEIADGAYRFLIEKAKLFESKANPGKYFASLDLVVQGGVKDGYRQQTTVQLNHDSQFLQSNCKQFMEAATGQEWTSGQEIEVDEDNNLVDILGNYVGASIKTKPDNKTGAKKTGIEPNTWCDPESIPVDDGSTEYPYDDDDDEKKPF